MKNQWRLIVGLLLVLLVVVFAVLNVGTVKVNFVLFKADWPLILIILGSLFIGALIAVLMNTGTSFQVKKQLKLVQAELETTKQEATGQLAIEKNQYEQKIKELHRQLKQQQNSNTTSTN